MLIIWDTVLLPEQEHYLHWVDSGVHYWPRSQYQLDMFQEPRPTDWWISFTRSTSGLVWVMRYSEHSRIVYYE
jgi:hypothetical protein